MLKEFLIEINELVTDHEVQKWKLEGVNNLIAMMERELVKSDIDRLDVAMETIKQIKNILNM
jgi:hypothetical protein|nr:MAG TPA: hypothetical protein [Caudoviricetes sp.]